MSRITETEDRISEVEDKMVEINEAERKKEKRIFPSTRVFSNESVLCIRWPKYWNFSISPSSEYSGLISFRMDCLDLLSVQGTLKSLL